MSDILDKLASVEARYEETAARLADPAVQADPNEFRALGKSLRDIEELTQKGREYRAVLRDLAGARELAEAGDAAAIAARRWPGRTAETLSSAAPTVDRNQLRYSRLSCWSSCRASPFKNGATSDST